MSSPPPHPNGHMLHSLASAIYNTADGSAIYTTADGSAIYNTADASSI